MGISCVFCAIRSYVPGPLGYKHDVLCLSLETHVNRKQADIKRAVIDVQYHRESRLQIEVSDFISTERDSCFSKKKRVLYLVDSAILPYFQHLRIITQC